MTERTAWNMRPAKPEDVRIEMMEGGQHVAAGLHVTGEEPGTLYWTKVALAELPNDLVGVEDLERFGIALDGIQAAPV